MAAQTPFAQCKGTVMEGGFRVPCIARWPGQIPADTVQNGIFSGMDWFPTFLAAAGNPNITDELLKGVKLGDRTYKNHLDGYNQMDLPSPAKARPRVTKSSTSAKAPSARCASTTTSIASSTSPTAGWVKRRMWTCPTSPTCASIRSSAWAGPTMGRKKAAQQYFDWFKYQFWRFVFVQQVMGKELQTFLDYPPMQRGASFNLDAVKAEMAKRMEEARKASRGPGQ